MRELDVNVELLLEKEKWLIAFIKMPEGCNKVKKVRAFYHIWVPGKINKTGDHFSDIIFFLKKKKSIAYHIKSLIFFFSIADKEKHLIESFVPTV